MKRRHVRNFRTRLDEDGRTVIPTEHRRKLGVEPLRGRTSLVRRYVLEERSLSEESISERREEAELE